MKKEEYNFKINGKDIQLLSQYDKKVNTTKIKIKDLEFDNLKEFYYFINMLADTAEILKNRELGLNDI
ncbi:MAG: hypothetical protein LBF97_05575 [Elusimicrobiota bacterium]|jgi:hypothetical protein|nr:hypothetical protein [Elusimicrobiota bacterium]